MIPRRGLGHPGKRLPLGARQRLRGSLSLMIRRGVNPRTAAVAAPALYFDKPPTLCELRHNYYIGTSFLCLQPPTLSDEEQLCGVLSLNYCCYFRCVLWPFSKLLLVVI